MKRINFSKCQNSNIEYSGVSEKIGIIFYESRLMLKFKKKTQYGENYNDISEYLGSSIFKMLGIESQSVYLGTYKNRKVVACLDFCYPNRVFKPFSDVGESSAKINGKYSYTFNEIEKLINNSKRFTSKGKQIAIKTFWDTYIVDCLIANGDRHAKNWGFIKEGRRYMVAPIFDNGECLYSSLIDEEEIKYILNNEEEINERVEDRPASIIRDNNGENNYYKIIRSKTIKECNDAIQRIVPRIKLERIFNLIDLIDEDDLSATRKEFIKTIIKFRYQKILLTTYKELSKCTK